MKKTSLEAALKQFPSNADIAIFDKKTNTFHRIATRQPSNVGLHRKFVVVPENKTDLQFADDFDAPMILLEFESELAEAKYQPTTVLPKDGTILLLKVTYDGCVIPIFEVGSFAQGVFKDVTGDFFISKSVVFRKLRISGILAAKAMEIAQTARAEWIEIDRDGFLR